MPKRSAKLQRTSRELAGSRRCSLAGAAQGPARAVRGLAVQGLAGVAQELAAQGVAGPAREPAAQGGAGGAGSRRGGTGAGGAEPRRDCSWPVRHGEEQREKLETDSSSHDLSGAGGGKEKKPTEGGGTGEEQKNRTGWGRRSVRSGRELVGSGAEYYSVTRVPSSSRVLPMTRSVFAILLSCFSVSVLGHAFRDIAHRELLQ